MTITDSGITENVSRSYGIGEYLVTITTDKVCISSIMSHSIGEYLVTITKASISLYEGLVT